MSRLDRLLEAEEEATVAAVDWGLREADIAPLQHAARLTTRGWELAGTHRALLAAAALHRVECVDGCGTCTNIRGGLASALAGLRVLVERERAAAMPRRAA